MNQKKIGGTKKKVTDALAMLLMIIVFCAFMFPFVMVIINSLKQKRDVFCRILTTLDISLNL